LARAISVLPNEYPYYDGIPSGDSNRVAPIDVIVTTSMNSGINTATLIRSIHRGLAEHCNEVLGEIPEDMDLLAPLMHLDVVHKLLHAAMQVPNVLIARATKVLHRKRRSLIPMLDNVLLSHYLRVLNRRDETQERSKAADLAMEVLLAFRNDLMSVRSELEVLSQLLLPVFAMTPLRVLEVLVWTEVEPQGYYRK
jgi:hypothetical protein